MSAHTHAVKLSMALDQELQVTDPGNGGAIVVQQGVAIQFLRLTSAAGSETRTLATPKGLEPGSKLFINYAVDGGTQVAITVASAINLSNNTIMTFADAGAYCELTVVERGDGTLRWLVTVNAAVALS